MDVVKRTENTLSTINLKPVANVEPAVRPAVAERASYRELPGLRHETKDVLQQLHANIQMIEDLNGRLGFVMSEVRSLIRR
jgi:hypothetical protein